MAARQLKIFLPYIHVQIRVSDSTNWSKFKFWPYIKFYENFHIIIKLADNDLKFIHDKVTLKRSSWNEGQRSDEVKTFHQVSQKPPWSIRHVPNMNLIPNPMTSLYDLDLIVLGYPYVRLELQSRSQTKALTLDTDLLKMQHISSKQLTFYPFCLKESSTWWFTWKWPNNNVTNRQTTKPSLWLLALYLQVQQQQQPN